MSVFIHVLVFPVRPLPHRSTLGLRGAGGGGASDLLRLSMVL